MESQDSRRLATTLEQLADQGADAVRVAAVVVSAWTAVEVALRPIIGTGGVAALYERSLYLTRRNHPWLAAIPVSADAGMDLSALERLLEQQPATAAAAGGGAQLAAFYELLGSLIGPSLTERLLGSTWSNPFSGTAVQDLP